MADNLKRSVGDAQRVDYGNKSNEMGKGKELSSKSLEMIAGGHDGGSKNGPTGSTRTYPKGSKVDLKPDFNPIDDKKRGASEWLTGGVKC